MWTEILVGLKIALTVVNHVYTVNRSIISSFNLPLFLFAEVQELKTNKGLALEDILREIHLFVMRSEYKYCSKYCWFNIHVIKLFSLQLSFHHVSWVVCWSKWPELNKVLHRVAVKNLSFQHLLQHSTLLVVWSQYKRSIFLTNKAQMAIAKTNTKKTNSMNLFIKLHSLIINVPYFCFN